MGEVSWLLLNWLLLSNSMISAPTPVHECYELKNMNKGQLRWNNHKEHDENYHWIRHVYQRINFNISYAISKQKKQIKLYDTTGTDDHLSIYKLCLGFIHSFINGGRCSSQPRKEADTSFETLHTLYSAQIKSLLEFSSWAWIASGFSNAAYGTGT